jgi:hypothetical protein
LTKVYVVKFGEYSDQGIAGVFSSEEKAKKYCEIQNEIEGYEDFWIDEYTLDEDEVPKEAKVATYYVACISTISDDWFKAGEIFSEGEERRIYTKDVEVEQSKLSGAIEVISTKSLEHAKKVAIEQYQIYTQQKFEDGELE